MLCSYPSPLIEMEIFKPKMPEIYFSGDLDSWYDRFCDALDQYVDDYSDYLQGKYVPPCEESRTPNWLRLEEGFEVDYVEENYPKLDRWGTTILPQRKFTVHIRQR